MTTSVRDTARLGDLIVAVYDIAAQYSKDPREISRLATSAVQSMLRRSDEPSNSARLHGRNENGGAKWVKRQPVLA